MSLPILGTEGGRTTLCADDLAVFASIGDPSATTYHAAMERDGAPASPLGTHVTGARVCLDVAEVRAARAVGPLRIEWRALRARGAPEGQLVLQLAPGPGGYVLVALERIELGD